MHKPWPCDGLAGHASSERSCMHSAPRSPSLLNSLISSVSDGWGVVWYVKTGSESPKKGRVSGKREFLAICMLSSFACQFLGLQPFVVNWAVLMKPFTLFNWNECYKLYFLHCTCLLMSPLWSILFPISCLQDSGIPYGSWEYWKNSILQCSITQQGA